VSMRSDFLDRVSENDRFLDELGQGLIFLQPPDRDGLREAMTQPVEMVGFRFETPALVDEMLGALASTTGALPLLQFAAAKLWDARDRERKLLTEAAYRQMGGVAGALASHANEVVSALTTAQQKMLREIFRRLVTSEGTRAIVDVSELRQIGEDPDEITRLVNLLVQSRLLVVQTRMGQDEPAVEIVHESLITQWPTLRLWLEEGQEDSAFLEQLRTTARQWDKAGRAAGLLSRGEAMEEARRFDRRFKGQLATHEREYLVAVLALAARSGRTKRILVVGTIVFLSALVVAGAIALLSIRAAEKEAVEQAERAKQEKERAQAAEGKSARQLSVIQQKEKERLEAETHAKEAAERQARAEEVAAKGQETIAMTNEQLHEALEKTEKLRRVAEKQSEKAQKEAERAEKAAEEERKAKRQTEKLLSDKKRELEALRKERSKIKTTLE